MSKRFYKARRWLVELLGGSMDIEYMPPCELQEVTFRATKVAVEGYMIRALAGRADCKDELERRMTQKLAEKLITLGLCDTQEYDDGDGNRHYVMSLYVGTKEGR